MLRRMRTDDAEHIVRWRSRPDVLSGMFSDTPPTLESHLRWFASMQEQGDREEFVIVERDGERPIGTVGLSSIDNAARRAEYGGLLGDPTARGKGYAYEASHLLLTHAFATMNLNKVYLQLLARNERALSLYERLGFVHEGRLRCHVVKGNQFCDVIVMGMLQEEWHG